jgi:hypothetical protein
MNIPINNLYNRVRHKIRRVWHKMYLKPYNKNLYTLENSDCYKVAIKADNYSLYIIVPSL